MSKRYIEINTISSGQPSPYADHQFIQELTFTQDDYRTKEFLEKNNLPLYGPWYIDEETAKAYARILCPWTDKEDPKANWASRLLVSFERLEPTRDLSRVGQGLGAIPSNRSDKWRIHVTSAYTD